MNNNKEQDLICSATVIHEDVLQRVRGLMTDETILKRMAEIYKSMNDPTRLKIINALLLAEMCTCDIAVLMNMSQPAVSYHLKALRQSSLIKYRREGKIVYYSLNDEHIDVLFRNGLQHAMEK